MSWNIKAPETDRLARTLAPETGESITVAAKKAFQERFVLINREAGSAPDPLAIVARGRARPTLDSRPAEEILGYDEQGLPL